MKQFSLKRDNGRDIKFNGENLSSVDSRDYGYKRSTAMRWTEMALYYTEGENFIVSISGRSNMPGEVDRVKAHVFENKQDMLDDIGFSYLAKAMFDEAGISSEEVIK
jgi:hypothetical protein